MKIFMKNEFSKGLKYLKHLPCAAYSYTCKFYLNIYNTIANKDRNQKGTLNTAQNSLE